MAYDNPIPGFGTRNCISLRLWSAKPSKEFDLEAFNTGGDGGGGGVVEGAVSKEFYLEAFNAGGDGRGGRRGSLVQPRLGGGRGRGGRGGQQRGLCSTQVAGWGEQGRATGGDVCNTGFGGGGRGPGGAGQQAGLCVAQPAP